MKFCNKCNEVVEKDRIRCIRCQCNYHQECFEAGDIKIVCARCHSEI